MVCSRVIKREHKMLVCLSGKQFQNPVTVKALFILNYILPNIVNGSCPEKYIYIYS